jgi:hypothetical protein
MRASRLALVVACAALAGAIPVLVSAQTPGPSPPAPRPSGSAGGTRAVCVEHLAPGATRPSMKDELPKAGTSGWAAELKVTIEHGKGETVLPEGFKLQRGSDAARALERNGFQLPETDGGAPPRVTIEEIESGVRTTVAIPLLLLPDEPGRHVLRLPPLPIAVARASGDLSTLCTTPHDILVEDPTANEAKPAPKPNPPPRPQREHWDELEQALIAVGIGLVLGTLLFWFLRRLAKRPKKVELPPPVLPWVAALTELDRIRRSGQIADGQTEEVFDQVSDCLRRYLGARYGFDGLEATTHEMKALLRRVRPPVPEMPAIGSFLDECDLVKFARVLPTPEDCVALLGRAESIVRWTTPQTPVAPREGRPTKGPPRSGGPRSGGPRSAGGRPRGGEARP